MDSDAPSASLHSRLSAIARGFGSEETSRAVLLDVIRHFSGAKRVLDVGCGDGPFLDLVRERGIESVGVDACEVAAGDARERGHRVEVGDAEQLVRRFVQAGESFEGVMLSQVIEHMAPSEVLSLFDALALLLPQGSSLVVVTPNPRNLIVLSEVFWLDPTHLRPYPRPLIERLGVEAGFRVRESYDDPASRPRRSGLKRLLADLRSRLTGADRSAPMDSVVVFER